MAEASSASKEKVVDEMVGHLQHRKDKYKTSLSLGVQKRVAILTCESLSDAVAWGRYSPSSAAVSHGLSCSGMDSRVHPEKFFGLRIGDAEVIRNAGGRVTADVLRSWLVCQELLDWWVLKPRLHA